MSYILLLNFSRKSDPLSCTHQSVHEICQQATWEKLRTHYSQSQNPQGAIASEATSAVTRTDTGTSVMSGAAGAAWSVCKTLAPVLGDALGGARHPALRVLGGALRYTADVADSLSLPVSVDGTETVLYLDDSGSMRSSVDGVWGKSGLQLGQDVLDQVAPLLEGPTRILKFGSHPKVLLPREELSQTQDLATTTQLLQCFASIWHYSCFRS